MRMEDEISFWIRRRGEEEMRREDELTSTFIPLKTSSITPPFISHSNSEEILKSWTNHLIILTTIQSKESGRIKLGRLGEIIGFSWAPINDPHPPTQDASQLTLDEWEVSVFLWLSNKKKEEDSNQL